MVNLPTRTGLGIERRVLPGIFGRVQRWWEGDGKIGVRDAIQVARREGRIPLLTAVLIVLGSGERECIQDLAKRRVDYLREEIVRRIKEIHQPDQRNR